MHITHTPEHNIGYIRFAKEQGKVARTIILSNDMHVDIAADGSIYGIELMNANEQLKGDVAAIIYENQQTHQRQELPL
jgi:uncharacterized protein YuzE